MRMTLGVGPGTERQGAEYLEGLSRVTDNTKHQRIKTLSFN